MFYENINIDDDFLDWASYDSAEATLEIGERNGTMWRYIDIPYSEYYDMMCDECPGRYYEENIRNYEREPITKHEFAQELFI